MSAIASSRHAFETTKDDTSSSPSTTGWFVIALLLSIVASLCILSTRNLYEDEVNSFLLIQQPIIDIWRAANHTDVHPPGMYVLSHLFYELIPSERWMTIGPLAILYAGLGFFVYRCRNLAAPGRLATITFFAAALLHPQILMWGNSVRWYPYWTSLALVVLALVLQLQVATDDELLPLSQSKALFLGVLIGVMFYINYSTLPYLFALVVSYLFRYPLKSQYVDRAVRMVIAFAFCAAPQVMPMVKVHLANFATQKASRVAALAKLSDGITLSEAMLPWHLIGCLFLVFVCVPAIWYYVRGISSTKMNKAADLLKFGQPAWPSLICFAIVLFGIAIASAAGAKARSFLLLCPIIALLIARSIKPGVWGYIRAALLILWIGGGVYNLVARQETSKGEFNDHGEEVVRLIHKQADGKRALIFVHEPPLTYLLNRAAQNQRWQVCSVVEDYVHHVPSASIESFDQPDYVFVVQSYVGALHEHEQELNLALTTARNTILAPRQQGVSPDRDVLWKKRIPGMEAATRTMPEYRFVVTYGPPRPGVDWHAVANRFSFFEPPEWEGIPPAQKHVVSNLHFGH